MISRFNMTFSYLAFARYGAATLLFILTMLIMPLYVEGDQSAYRGVYSVLADFDLKDAFLYYKAHLSSSEYVHFFLSWVLSPIVDKDLFIAVSNAIFGYVLMVLLQKWKATPIISFMVIFTNFYLFVLYFAAERLKFGFIFLTISLIYLDKIKRFYGFTILAIISHVQVLIVYGSIVLYAGIKKLFEHIHNGTIPKAPFFLIPLLLIPLYLMGDQLFLKFQAYYGQGGFQALIKVVVFFLLAMFYSKDKGQTITIFLPICMAVFLLGGDRINLFGYFAFLYYGLQVKGGWNIGVIGTSAYYLCSTVIFLNNIFQTGNGFSAG